MAETKMVRDLFLWAMSAIYLFAFASLYVQIPGLYGNNGILPAKLVLQKEAESFGELLTTQPTLLRLLPHIGLDVQTGMDALCVGGVILSSVAMVSRIQRNCIVFGFLWMFYLSLFQVGQTFLWFQWDILLLEAGFLCILVAPLNLIGWSKRVRYHKHDHITLWLVKWLLFRLMFASGVVKLTSGCPTWWGLTALNYHYETQCIATPLAWYAHQFPEWIQKLSVVFTFVIEIALPFLFFSPVRLQRVFAFYAQMFLMSVIILTGNYNFFNLLTCALCLSLVDDSFLRGWMGQKSWIDRRDDPEKLPMLRLVWKPIKWFLNLLVFGGLIYWTVTLFTLRLKQHPLRVDSKIAFNGKDFNVFLEKVVPFTIWLGALSLSWEVLKSMGRSLIYERSIVSKLYNFTTCFFYAFVAVGVFSISLVEYTVIEENTRASIWPVLRQWKSSTYSFQITSSYGLFRRMTGVGGRPEVVIEGSNSPDKGWKEYHFLYKPGNESESLPFVAPHQPRLDWQMWFAALGSYQHNAWFLNLIHRLFHNQPEVLELMGENPFPNKAPKYLRAHLYHYHFTRADEKHEWYSDSDWWTRKLVKEYLPVISKDEPSFANYIQQSGIKQASMEETDEKQLFILARFFRNCFVVLRSLLGQGDGFITTVSLFMTALVLSFLDPTLRLLQGSFKRSNSRTCR